MKNLINTFLVFFAMQMITNAQCAINYNEILENRCSGVYLKHQEFNNSTARDIRLVLTKDNNYAIYLLNPSKSLPILKVLNNNTSALQNFQEKINTEENYSVYKFTVKETREYHFILDFKTEEKACVLLAIYLRNANNLKPGIYKSFDEFKYDNPSIEFNYPIITKKHNFGKDQIMYYKVDLKEANRKTMDKVFGFFDGKDVFININYPKLTSNPKFAKMEYLYKYYFYEGVDYIPVYNGSTMILVIKPVQKLMNINTGEVMELNKQKLREILANDQSLLDDFNKASRKNILLKEYLTKYLEKHFNN